MCVETRTVSERDSLESREPRLDGEVGRNVQGPHWQTE